MESAGEFVTAPKYYWSCCFVCRKVASHDVPLKRCARCHCMFYCSKVTNVLFVCLSTCFFVQLSLSFHLFLTLVFLVIHDVPLKRCARCHCMFYCSKVCFFLFLLQTGFFVQLSVFLFVSLSCLSYKLQLMMLPSNDAKDVNACSTALRQLLNN